VSIRLEEQPVKGQGKVKQGKAGLVTAKQGKAMQHKAK